MKVTKEMQPCVRCKGTGLEQIDGRTIDCLNCQGYGERLVTVRKDDDDGEKPERYERN